MTEREAPEGGLFPAAALEHLTDAVVGIDADGQIVIFNGAAERLWRRDRADMLGQLAAEHLPALASPPADGVWAVKKVAIGPLDAELPMEAVLSRLPFGGSFLTLAILNDTSGAALKAEFELLELVSAETERTVMITDAAMRVVHVNRAFSETFGYRPAEVMGRAAQEVFAGRHISRETLALLQQRLDKGQSINEPVLVRDGKGRTIWAQVAVNPVFDDAGKVRHFVGVISNVTEGKQMQELQREVLQAVAGDLPLPAIMGLICERIERVAQDAICAIHMVDDERRLRRLAAPSLPSPVADLMDGLTIGPGSAICGSAAFRGEAVVVEDIAENPLCGDVREALLLEGLQAAWSSPIKLKDGRVVGTLGLFYQDKGRPSAWHEQIVATCLHLAMLAIERHDNKERIARLAYHDSLTGLPNRRQLRDIFAERAVAMPDGQRLAFLFLDIDRFKDVNDTLGHSTGDRLLVEIARRLGRQLGPHDMLGRYGGDEFVLVLADCDTARAASFASQLIERLRVPVVIDDLRLPVSASIGIGIYPEDGTNEETLLKHADTAMYEAKNAGGETYRFFRPEMNRLAAERLKLGAALREAVERGQFKLHYQPQVRCGSGVVVGAEGLARWHHPLLGEVSPARFIPVAEELGLIEPIGRWALEEACRQLTAWRRSGVMLENISVNLSALHFRNPGLTGVVASTLSRHGIKPSMLTVEITEGVIMDGNPVAIETAKAVHALGVKLSLDDFGTGYSSLSYLARLPIDELKIDRSFMQDLEHDKNAQAIATAVVRIGQSLSLRVVAEGVETIEQHAFIDGLGCDLVQGFLVSRALAPADFETWYRRYTPDPALGRALPGAA